MRELHVSPQVTPKVRKLLERVETLGLEELRDFMPHLVPIIVRAQYAADGPRGVLVPFRPA